MNAKIAALEAQIAALTALVSEHSSKLQFVSVDEGEINKLAGPHFIIEGANVHVRGEGPATEDGSGLGNLIIGFNELDWMENSEPEFCIEPDCPIRTGSHNLVVGPDHSFTHSGSVLFGSKNASYSHHNVSAGRLNEASGLWSSILGGEHNVARGQSSSILGGGYNETGRFA